ncbi:MAG: hypothetical protein RLZZ336_823 [Cyanobacteriota bacterium]|jgi:predicted metal-dependent hydrolase
MPSEEQALQADPRLAQAIDLFNAGEWYACHDGFEELWHETQGPMRPVLQGILQIAVAQLHRQRDNNRGATILMGEGLGRLRGCEDAALGLDLADLRSCAARHLAALQGSSAVDGDRLPPLQLRWL